MRSEGGELIVTETVRRERQPTTAEASGGFFGHPWGLATLFGAEMWERFSFYGLRALLVLYLTAGTAEGGLNWHESTAVAFYGVYIALVYMLALPGGWVADRLLGGRRAVLVGGGVIATGHYLMAIPVTATFFAGLACVVIGTGLLKPNISALVGKLYGDADEKRDAAFSLFYVGINLGAFAAPLVVSTVGEKVNWHLGFGAAGVGMTLGLVMYVAGRRTLRGVGEEPPNPADRATVARVLRWTALGAAVAAVLLAADAALGTLTMNHVVNALTVVIVCVPIVYFTAMLRSPRVTPTERVHVRAYLFLFLSSAVFWMIYDQAGSVLNLFAEKEVDRSVLGWTVPVGWFQSVNPVLIFIFAPLYAWMWVRLGPRAPRTSVKFSVGLVGIGSSFLLMALAARAAEGPGRINPFWLVAVYLVQTLSELTLSPVGLSVTTRLAPAAFTGQMLGLWFLAVAVGDAAGGQVARLRAQVGSVPYFLTLGVLAILVGFALYGARRHLNRLLGDVH
jgi:POT family proton-dependent oligopeptide transporter